MDVSSATSALGAASTQSGQSAIANTIGLAMMKAVQNLDKDTGAEMAASLGVGQHINASA